MQDEVNEKTIALYIKTGKLTAQTLQKAMKAILSKGKKPVSYTHLDVYKRQIQSRVPSIGRRLPQFFIPVCIRRQIQW